MNWLKKIINKLFKKQKTNYLLSAKDSQKKVSSDNDFRISLKQTSDSEIDDRNGYHIKPNYTLEEMR